MFGFLGFLLILFLLIVFIGFSILGNILRVLFGFGKRNTNRTFTYTNQKTDHTSDNLSNDDTESYSESSSSQKHHQSSGKKKKIFDDDEGEYVDYEEVK